MLGRAIVDGASLSHAGHGRIGAGATGALVQIELIAGIVDAGPKCARAFRRRQVSPATFATWTTLAGIVDYSRAEAMEDGASLLGAGQPGTVASASDAWILGRGHRSIRRHHLSVHVASSAYGAALAGRRRNWIRARRVAMQSRLGDHSSFASEDSTGIVSLDPLGLGSMMNSVSRATFTPVTTLVLPWLQQRVTTFDAWALLFPALDETILLYFPRRGNDGSTRLKPGPELGSTVSRIIVSSLSSPSITSA